MKIGKCNFCLKSYLGKTEMFCELVLTCSGVYCSLASREKRLRLSGVKMLAVMCLSAATKACLCRVHTDGAGSFVCSVSHVAASELPGLALWAWLQA